MRKPNLDCYDRYEFTSLLRVDSETETDWNPDVSYQTCGYSFNDNLVLEKGLWVAVIQRAVLDLSCPNERIRNSALSFFEANQFDNQKTVLEWICEDLLNLNVNQIRSGIKNYLI